MARPVPIPNTAVKHSLADGSGFIDSARVGCRQIFLHTISRWFEGGESARKKVKEGACADGGWGLVCSPCSFRSKVGFDGGLELLAAGVQEDARDCLGIFRS